MKLNITIILTFLLFITLNVNAQELELLSPNKDISVKISVDNAISYKTFNKGKELFSSGNLFLTLKSGKKIGVGSKLINKNRKSVNRIVKPIVREKFAEISENYNELKLDFKDDFSLTFRVYNNGVAYRFETKMSGEIVIENENIEYNFPENYMTYWSEEENLQTATQVYYDYKSILNLNKTDLASLPLLIDSKKGPKFVITESDLEDYPGMWFNGTSDFSLKGIFPRLPKEPKYYKEGYIYTDNERNNFIAKTSGTRTFPWRIVAIANNDSELITNQITYLLGKENVLENTSWIKPGKIAWDWWNANNIYGVDFEAGINTETYKYYIDFAAEYNLEYIIMDEGWSVPGNLLKLVPEIDMIELSTYAKERGVGIILWVMWETLDQQLHEALDQLSEWGIKGIKVDFMDRDDQWMVNYYHRVAKECAKRELLVNFHGSYKPAGIRRMYPNVMTREGVKGAEQSKWSKKQTPEHNLTLPFSRMVAGPLDYTPGAMSNAQEKNFEPIFDRPMSMGTRCHQLAMYVVYESPLQMLCDTPNSYRKEPEMMEFLSVVPTVWDNTIVLDSKISDHILMARKSGKEWYVGAMTDGSAKELELDLSFLDKDQSYNMIILQDGINAHRYASDFKKIVRKVSRNDIIKIKMAPGGGWAARIFK